ncbi:hypothetical protein BpHYR1_011520 [Brachionus plicatilis]|uniref:Uncharacterized protein n=1 Tax=Brachionus plicatilis TaxID=10195 RepID=A0A3M7QZQ8_BRAPC|nr:hypothetical protein BpHYR1_011520 [Brachionus plicatilis]
MISLTFIVNIAKLISEIIPKFYYLVSIAKWLHRKSVFLSFRSLPELFRSDTVPVYSYRFLAEETHFGDTPYRLAISFFCFLSAILVGLTDFFKSIFWLNKDFCDNTYQFFWIDNQTLDCASGFHLGCKAVFLSENVYRILGYAQIIRTLISVIKKYSLWMDDIGLILVEKLEALIVRFLGTVITLFYLVQLREIYKNTQSQNGVIDILAKNVY